MMKTIFSTLLITSAFLFLSVETSSGSSPDTRDLLTKFKRIDIDLNRPATSSGSSPEKRDPLADFERMALYSNRQGSSSHASSSSGGSRSVPPFTPDGKQLGPGEELIVHRGKVLTKANIVDHVVIPFKNEWGEFLQFKIVKSTSTALTLGPTPLHYESLVVNPTVWLQDIASFNNAHKPHWIYDTALILWEMVKQDERKKRHDQFQRRINHMADMRNWAHDRLRRGNGL